MRQLWRRLALGGFMLVLGALAAGFAPGAEAQVGVYKVPDCGSAQGVYFNNTFGRCMNVGFFSGESTSPASNIGTLPVAANGGIDTRYSYSGKVGTAANRDTGTAWWVPTVCPVAQFAVNIAVLSNAPVIPPCNVEGDYATTFINMVGTNINANYACEFPLTNNPDPNSCAGVRRHAMNSVLIMATMLGVKGPAFQTSPIPANNMVNAITWANTHYAQWASLVRLYDGAGLINWDLPQIEDPGHINSTVINYGQDYIFFAWDQRAYPAAVIQIKDPSGAVLWTMNRACGNLVGNIHALPPSLPDFNVVAGIKQGVGTPANNGFVQSGKAYQVIPYVYNTMNVPPPETLVVNYTPNITVTGVTAGNSVVDPVNHTITFSNISIPANGIGAAINKLVNWAVNAGAINGSTVRFDAYATPQNRAGGHTPTASIQFIVQNPRYPSVVGLGGDIHAGGGLCDNFLSTGGGNIAGLSNGVSGGQYVVSASANNGINNFYSNNSSVSSSLTLGNTSGTGGYAQVCRPDLVANANQALPTLSPAAQTIAGPTFVTTGQSGVWVYNGGGNLNVNGTVDGSLTIFATNPGATITINGDIKLNTTTANARKATPSLGILAAGDIGIASNVTQVDAYLFSNSTINTCSAGNCNTPVLKINGFIMSKDLLLTRLGPANSSQAQLAEQVTLNPQIYLNPPPLFNGSVDNLFLEGQGEKAPLF